MNIDFPNEAVAESLEKFARSIFPLGMDLKNVLVEDVDLLGDREVRRTFIFAKAGASVSLQLRITGPHLILGAIVYLTEHKYFDVEHYFKAKKLPGWEPFFAKSIADKAYSKEECIADCLQVLIEALKGPLGEIARGERWEDVPFDWMGYK